ncbi:hypothetical protein METBIDRAFT_79758 [Metschnikowia bicuspidata var. bicuspidata NRRL YB-4993]|uniref:Uncharacterized protein n=1 Tax=Metschnikowia bicuspidata var. bicuspidata NRRL YB-4993 TaxID=869754 RepID=A0A1A0H5K1_9ASCO|nr:hypothetical protein METBIDRAFT_79758 [Metschnikowia bicuspidata var. bicuspidata NRRL YB-4993]OBA19225.1 hypothetical protein METBIDRAFT_79758 [Metschnikowia bicuspidata var. bicuspidata NRRL YB-4993]
MSSSGVQTASHGTGPEQLNGSDPNHNNKIATNETVEPKYRKRTLVKKHSGPSNLKYLIWLAGHVLSIVFGVVTFTWQVLWLPNVFYINSISYRLSLIGSVMAFAATVSKKYGWRYLPPFSTLFAQQNFQFLAMSVIWCFTFKSVFKIIPTFMISLLQLSAHKKIDVVLKHSDFLALLISYDQLALVVYLLIRTLLFRSTSGYQMVIVVVFMWLRALFDKGTANLLGYAVNKADGKISGIKNEKVRKAWGKIKHFLAEKQRHGIYSDGLDDEDAQYL